MKDLWTALGALVGVGIIYLCYAIIVFVIPVCLIVWFIYKLSV